MTSAPYQSTSRLMSVTLDEASIGRGTPEQEHERTIAIYDLIEENLFAVPGHSAELYSLHISLVSNRLVLDVRDVSGSGVVVHVLSLTPFRQVVKDYFLICESYYQAIRSASLSQIEAIDMGRRGLHNEAAELLMKRLEGKLAIDFDTARRLFTLVSALRWKG
ncbi:MAG: UPF0262 family protein [Hyphomicrobiales bacterium]